MSGIAIKLENISKQYRLGVVGTGTLSHDLNRWFAKIRGKEDPTLKIGQENSLAQAGGDYVWALQNINLEVKKGEILGIIGKNGAGKSTLLKLLSRVTGPTTGSIKVNGRIASLLEVGTGFHPELTGKENIFLNGAILGMTKNDIRRKLDEIVEFAGVAKYLDTPVKRYSSGMYVRLAFAVAAHLEPDILVVDEVLAVGDAEFQKKAIGKMQDVSKGEGRTVLFVSHNMGSVKALCTKGLLLKTGTIDFVGNIVETVNIYMQKGKSEQNINLSERKDRSGNGAVIFTNVSFSDEFNNTLSSIFGGSKIKINLELFSKTESDNAIIEIRFFSINGSLLTVVNNFHFRKKISYKKGNNQVILEFESFPFSIGKYYAHLISVVDGVWTDDVESAFEFIITESDFYKTGLGPDDKSIVQISCKWN